MQVKPRDGSLSVQKDVRSRLLANHRMPAYRARAVARIKAGTGLEAGGEHSRTAHLTEDLLPRAVVYSAVAQFFPLPPPQTPASANQNR